MGVLSEYNLTDELTQDALKELGFNKSYAMTLSDDKAYDNVFKAKFYSRNIFGFNHKSFYCSYRYFPELNYLMVSIEAMPSDYLFSYNYINAHDVNVNKRFDCIVKHYSELLVYLTDEWLVEQVKNFKFLIPIH